MKKWRSLALIALLVCCLGASGCRGSDHQIRGTAVVADLYGFSFITRDGAVCQVRFGESAELVEGLEQIAALCGTGDGGSIDAITTDGAFLTTYPIQPEQAAEFYPAEDGGGNVGVGSAYAAETARQFAGLSGLAYGCSGYPDYGLFAYEDGRVLLLTPLLGREALDALESAWRDVVQVAQCGDDIVGLTRRGTILCRPDSPYRDIYQTWTDVAAVYGGGNHIYALRTDGTVVTEGKDFWGECDISSWANIVSVAAARTFTVGLRADGTVAAAGANTYGQCNVEAWRDIVAIAAAETYTLGIDRQGNVWISGRAGGADCHGLYLAGGAADFVGLDLLG